MEDLSGMRHHLMCPISLQPMQDPAPTGITYDRGAIERWLAAGHGTCPVTGQPLALADLTPNHTLRRLIQSWRLPSSTSTPPAPLAGEAKLLADDAVEQQRRPPEVAAAADVVKKLLCTAASSPSVEVLCQAAEVASESNAARRRMVDAGVHQRVLRLIVSSANELKSDPGHDEVKSSSEITRAIEAGLDLVRALAVSGDKLRPLVVADTHVHDLLDTVMEVLVSLEQPAGTGGGNTDTARASAVRLLNSVTEAAGSAVLERLRPALFHAVTEVVRSFETITSPCGPYYLGGSAIAGIRAHTMDQLQHYI